MKKITRIFMAAVAVASMAACVQENAEPSVTSPLALDEFGANAESATKVTIGADWKLLWEEGDAADIHDGAAKTVFTATTAGESTILKANDVAFAREDSKTYYAVYPSAEANEFDGSSVTLTVAGDRTAVDGQYPSAPAVGVTEGSEANFTFRNVCGLVSFAIAAGQNITSVVIFGGNNENMAGTVKVNAETAGYELVEGTGVKEILLTPAEGETFAAGRYYVAVLPQEFTKGLSVTLYGNDGTRLRKNLNAFTLGRSTHVDVQTGGTFKTEYTIKNADELVSFLALAPNCAAGVKATLANDIDLSGVTLPAVSTFTGTFDGNGKNLKNWTTDRPLFDSIVAGATVKNIILDASCTLNMKETDSRQAFVVGENSGTVSGCTNKADITYTRATEKPMQSRMFGAIVGFSEGLVSDCHNEGNITITIPVLDYTETSGNTYQHQRVGGVVGGFAVASGKVGITRCTNTGKITYNFMGVFSSEDPYKQFRPHFAIGGVCAVVANNGTPSKSSEAANNGTIEYCTNSGQIKLYQEGINGSNYSNVGGVVGYLEGSISYCENTSTGNVTLQLNNSNTTKVSSPAVGGVVGNALTGDVLNCSNAGAVYMTGYIQGGTSDAAYAGGSEIPAIGGIVAKAGAKTEKTELKVKDCMNSGNVSVKVWNSSNIRMGGIVGWTSIPVVGTSANALENSGQVTVETSSTFKTAYVGGVIGQSISTFDKIYNTGAVTVVNSSTTTEQKAYVGGVSGYMSKKAADTFKQGHNHGMIKVSGGKSDGKEAYMIGGCIGFSDATAVTSNGTSWAQCNSNYGDISVDCPVIQYVGGVVAKVGNASTGSKTTAFTQCRNRGNITVNYPGSGSYVGGVFGHVTRGSLGNANTCGIAEDKVLITVKGASSDTYVGGYIGEKENDHGTGTNAGLWTMRLSGFGMYASIEASGATAGLIAGHLEFTGNSSSNIVMLGSDTSARPKIAKDCKLNDRTVGDLTSTTIAESDFFAKITPSETSTVTGPDNRSMAGRYMFFAANGTESVSYEEGLQNY